jgi:xanthine dehydrogenase YagS FAD-binding subunit
MCVALAALDAIVRVRGPKGERQIAFGDFHRLPGDTPQRETNLEPDELIIAVDLPAIPFAARSYYLKVRDRASYAFALVSVAAAVDLGSNQKINAARIALGGVAHKPWRANAAEKKLIDREANDNTFRAAAEAELAPAKGYKYNSYKIELAKHAIVRALTIVAEMT